MVYITQINKSNVFFVDIFFHKKENEWNIFEWYFNFSLFQLGWMGSRKQSTQVCGYQLTETEGTSESQSVSLFATWIGEMPVS